MRFAPVVLLPALFVGIGVGVYACSGDDNGSTVPRAKVTDGTSSSSGGSGTSGGSSGASTSGAPGPDDGGAQDDGGLAATFKAADINHVLSTGQSLSVGAIGTPVLS